MDTGDRAPLVPPALSRLRREVYQGVICLEKDVSGRNKDNITSKSRRHLYCGQA